MLDTLPAFSSAILIRRAFYHFTCFPIVRYSGIKRVRQEQVMPFFA